MTMCPGTHDSYSYHCAMSYLSEATSLLTVMPGTDNDGTVAGHIFCHHSFKCKSHEKERRKEQENEGEVTNDFQ